MAEAVDAVVVQDGKPAKGGKKGLLVGLVAAVLLGGGGFFAVSKGYVDPMALLGGGGGHADAGGYGDGHGGEAGAEGAAGVAFVAMDPIMVSLPPGSSARHLRFIGQLEVRPEAAAEVTTLMPRVLDALNTYLRAVQVRDLENPAALQRLRAEMLRRVQVSVGEGKVEDLLVAEFILN
jgi:flagellar FliL protein